MRPKLIYLQTRMHKMSEQSYLQLIHNAKLQEKCEQPGPSHDAWF